MELHVTRAGIVVPVPVDPLGIDGPTRGQARGPRWRTTSPNRFVPADVAREPAQQRIVEAVAGAPEGAAATGWSGLNWQCARWFDGRSISGELTPVLLAIGDSGHLARREGVRFCQDWLFEDDIIMVDGLPITRAERSVCAEALRAPTLAETVRVIDMAAADDLVDIEEMRAYAARIKGRPHTVRLNGAIDLADENVWSPQEVGMRLRWIGRRPSARLLCNPPIFDLDGKHLLTPDLFDPVAGVVGEYNGALHEGKPVRRRDLDREELCRELELEVATMLSTDLRDVRSFEQRLDGAYRRAAAVDRSRRRWTLEQPEWWVDTSTVAARRRLDEHDRRIWLPWKAA